MEESCLVEWFTISYSSRQWSCQGESSARQTVAPPCSAGHTQTFSGCIMLRRTFSWEALASLVLVEETMKVVDCLSITADRTLIRRLFFQLKLDSSSRTACRVKRLELC
ncbi:hypothetical protein TNCV_832581 [Trichonephila clavipes]|nr:hypothetical protein TNCV_832581 [Trichonephila clavipes]